MSAWRCSRRKSVLVGGILADRLRAAGGSVPSGVAVEQDWRVGVLMAHDKPAAGCLGGVKGPRMFQQRREASRRGSTGLRWLCFTSCQPWGVLGWVMSWATRAAIGRGSRSHRGRAADGLSRSGFWIMLASAARAYQALEGSRSRNAAGLGWRHDWPCVWPALGRQQRGAA